MWQLSKQHPTLIQLQELAMNKRDRQIQFFLQLFLLLTGLYFIGYNFWKLSFGFWEHGLFEFSQERLPVFSLSAGILSGLMSITGAIALWIRTGWAYGFCLFTSGMLFSYTLLELADVVFFSPAHAIPMVLILFVVMQTFPFLIRKTHRQL